MAARKVNSEYLLNRLNVKIHNYEQRKLARRKAQTQYERHEAFIIQCMVWEYYDSGVIDSDTCYQLIAEIFRIQEGKKHA